MLQKLDGEFLATESVFGAGRTLRTKQNQFVHREISLVEQSQELLTNGAARAYNSYFHILLFKFLRAKLQLFRQ